MIFCGPFQSLTFCVTQQERQFPSFRKIPNYSWFCGWEVTSYSPETRKRRQRSLSSRCCFCSGFLQCLVVHGNIFCMHWDMSTQPTVEQQCVTTETHRSGSLSNRLKHHITQDLTRQSKIKRCTTYMEHYRSHFINVIGTWSGHKGAVVIFSRN